MMGLVQLFASNNWLSINRTLMKVLGLKTTVLLGELCSEYDYWEREGKLVDGMFYCSIEHLEEQTTLSRYEQTTSINQLKELGILEVTLKGVPATRYFKFNKSQFVNFLQSGLSETNKLDSKKLYSSNTINTSNKEETKVSTNVDTEISQEISSNDTETISHVSTPHTEGVSITNNIRTPKKVLTSEKPKKKNLWEKCTDEINRRYTDTTLHVMLVEYLDYRLKSKLHPMGFNGWVGLLNKLDKLGKTDEEKCKIIEQSIKMKWDTFAELKTWGKGSSRYSATDVFAEGGMVHSIPADRSNFMGGMMF